MCLALACQGSFCPLCKVVPGNASVRQCGNDFTVAMALRSPEGVQQLL
jgi:hypothetical protein